MASVSAKKNKLLSLAVLPFVIVFVFTAGEAVGQEADTAMVLDKVVVTDRRKPDIYKSNLPVQSLNSSILHSIHATSVADAARLFSGALIKDYGGIGGLKTISVRSLGSANNSIFYDGIAVSDMQTSQIDLSRFPATFISRISLYQGQPADLLFPAKAYAAASVLEIETSSFQPISFLQTSWQAGVSAASFATWQPFAAISLPIGKYTLLTSEAQYLTSKGNFPFTINNGIFSEERRRSNSSIESYQAEINLAKQFRDSSLLQAKVSYYNSDRELPGAIIFFNPRSAQQLWNTDLLMQARYHKQFDKKTTVLFSGKYANSRTRYKDPDFLNGRGGLDSRYTQQEGYGSAVARQRITGNLEMSLASDVSYSRLFANTNNFVYPSRLGLWNNVSLKYKADHFDVNTSVVSIFIKDDFRATSDDQRYDRLVPAISASYRADSSSPWLFRVFYKEAFRMPTFNDLYYNFIGNRGLRPESSTQYNAGITYSGSYQGALQRLNISADGYVNKITDKILAVPGQNLFNWSMVNVGKVRITGLDLNAEISARIFGSASLFSRIAATWQQALDVTDPSSAYYRNRIPYTPDLSGSWLSILRLEKWTGAYSMLYSGKRYALGANDDSNLLSSWISQDLSLSRSIPFDQIELSIKAEVVNLTNQQYQVIRYFPMPGRNYKITLTIHNL